MGHELTSRRLLNGWSHSVRFGSGFQFFTFGCDLSRTSVSGLMMFCLQSRHPGCSEVETRFTAEMKVTSIRGAAPAKCETAAASVAR